MESHEIFEDYLSKYFKQQNVEYRIEDGVVHILNDDFHGLNNLGLQNIAQYCRNEGVEKYEEHIKGHFDTIIRGKEFEEEFDRIKTDYEKVKSYLGIRLYNSQTIANVGFDKTVGKEVGGDLYAMLVYDLPDTVHSVAPSNTQVWNLPMEKLWKESVNNSNAKYPPNILERELHGIKFKTVEEDHFYSPNIIFNIEDHPELIGQHGAIISIPTRHIVIIYPINDLGVVNALTTQIQVTYNVSHQGPGTLSNKIYWYHNGVLEDQPYALEEDGKLAFNPTENFVEMLNGFQS